MYRKILITIYRNYSALPFKYIRKNPEGKISGNNLSYRLDTYFF